MEKEIKKAEETLFNVLKKAIIELVAPFKELNVEYLYRYIDDDNMQDIIRVKKVLVNDGELAVVSDEWNGEDYPDDVYFSDDGCFEDENTDSFEYPCLFNIELLMGLYDEIVYYAIPRLERGED